MYAGFLMLTAGPKPENFKKERIFYSTQSLVWRLYSLVRICHSYYQYYSTWRDIIGLVPISIIVRCVYGKYFTRLSGWVGGLPFCPWCPLPLMPPVHHLLTIGCGSPGRESYNWKSVWNYRRLGLLEHQIYNRGYGGDDYLVWFPDAGFWQIKEGALPNFCLEPATATKKLRYVMVGTNSGSGYL